MSGRPSANIRNLRRLLALARDLLEATDLRSTLKLIGPVIPTLLFFDRALLFVFTGTQQHAIAFDQFGNAQSVNSENDLYQYAQQVTVNAQLHPVLVEPTGFHAIHVSNCPGSPPASILVVPYPWTNPVGALVIGWNKKKRKQFLINQIAIVNHIAELAHAALGNLRSRQDLEKLVGLQIREFATANEEHVKEMLRRDRVEEEIRHISITDVMTGLRNRRGFFLQADQSFKVAQRQRLTGSVIFADIDGLKMVNDQLGHDVGDQLIRDCANVLQGSFRSSDVISRLGGDEFAVFTLESANTDAILARIKDRIQEFNRGSCRPYQVALSVGIVQCDLESNLKLGDYLLMADTQMYAQKKGHDNGQSLSWTVTDS